MLPKRFSISTSTLESAYSKTLEYETYSIDQLLKYQTLNIYQVGVNCCTYLPHLLTKFLNLANINYHYVFNTVKQYNNYDNISVYQTNQTDMKMVALDIPLNESAIGSYIIWCWDISILNSFITEFVRINKDFINRYPLYPDSMCKIIIPFLSNKGITMQAYCILPKKSKIAHFENIYKETRPEYNKLFSKAYAKYFQTHWEYGYDKDMLATYHIYNFFIENILKNKSVYSEINNDGIGTYNINQSLENIITATLSESF